MKIDRELLEILHILNRQEYVPTEQLAIDLSRTNRTIRSYLKRLNGILLDQGAMIVTIYGKGNHLQISDHGVFHEFMKEQKGISVYDRSFCLSYYLQAWLLENKALSMEKMEERFLRSKKELRKDWKMLDSLFRTFSCHLENRPYTGSIIRGNPAAVRQLCLYVILKDLYGCRESFLNRLGWECSAFSLYYPHIRENLYLSIARVQAIATGKELPSARILAELNVPSEQELSAYSIRLPQELHFLIPYLPQIRTVVLPAIYRITHQIAPVFYGGTSMKTYDLLAWIWARKLLDFNLPVQQPYLQEETAEVAMSLHSILSATRRNFYPTGLIVCPYNRQYAPIIEEAFHRSNPFWHFKIIDKLPSVLDEQEIPIFWPALPKEIDKSLQKKSLVVFDLLDPGMLRFSGYPWISAEKLVPEDNYYFRLDLSGINETIDFFQKKFETEPSCLTMMHSGCALFCLKACIFHPQLAFATLKIPREWKEEKIKLILVAVCPNDIDFLVLDYCFEILRKVLSDSILQNRIIHSDSYQKLISILDPVCQMISETFGNPVP